MKPKREPSREGVNVAAETTYERLLDERQPLAFARCSKRRLDSVLDLAHGSTREGTGTTTASRRSRAWSSLVRRCGKPVPSLAARPGAGKLAHAQRAGHYFDGVAA